MVSVQTYEQYAILQSLGTPAQGELPSGSGLERLAWDLLHLCDRKSKDMN
jgi:hypothetical protein